jgi:uncharacterized protein YegL
MNAFDQLDRPPRRVLTIFFLIDTSGSMYGTKIAAVNTALQETIPIIAEISNTNPDAEIKIAAMDFSTDCQWMYDEPQSAEGFQWLTIEASGLTQLGAACEELNNKLSHSHGFMNEASGSYAPVIILLSDGEPTDNYEYGLARLKQNNWYKAAAAKLAIAIGDDANKNVLTDFTGGNSECVMTVHNIPQLKSLIRTVSVTASKVASKGASVGLGAPDTKAEEVQQQIQEAIDDDPTLKGIDKGNSTDNAGTDDWTGW